MVPGENRDNKENNVLITGPPGIGKTTVLQETSRKLPGEVAGFITREIRHSGKRTGFELVSLSGGNREELAAVNFSTPYRVGRYSVKPENMESFVQEIEDALCSKNRVFILIDEIGKMELFSERFYHVVLQAMDSPFPVLATIMPRPNSYCDSIKNRPDARLVEVTRENRDELPGQLVATLS